MNTLQLQLIHRNSPESTPPSGFVILGAAAEQWLRVLLPGTEPDAGRRYQSWRFFSLPHSATDNRPLGLVCLPAATTTAYNDRTPGPEGTVAPPAGTIGLTCKGVRDPQNASCLWMPTDSHCYPELPEDTFLPMLPQIVVCVWLASTGLVGFEPRDELRIHDLVSLPPRRDDGPVWRAPPQPVVLPQRLAGLSLSRPPELETIFGDSAHSIGNQGDAVGQWSSDTLSGQIQAGLLKWMKQLGISQPESNKPSDASGEAGSLSWLSSKLSNMLQSQREQQLQKLVEMLGRDPDQALQYALPIGGEAAYRGIAAPSGWLRSQAPDFSLGGLGGGGPADFWNIGQAMRDRLDQAYREQANRELSLGRHRRAAYIYAHLLGDYSSAAAALEQGRFWAEAAALYQHKLRCPEDAARCLAESGQFEAAAAIYEQKNDFVAAGEVWQRAGDEDRARASFRQAVQFQIANQKPILAAELLYHRLQQREAAIALLLKQWPGGIEPVRAMLEAFTWLGEAGEHQRAREVLTKVNAPSPQQDLLAVATVSGELAVNYPDLTVRDEAEDFCRVAIATELASVPAIEMRERMTRMRKLFPEDANLQRDVTRFLTSRPLTIGTASASKPVLGGLEYLGRFDLPPAERYVQLQMIRGDLLALGADHYKLLAVRVADLATATPRLTDCRLQLGQPLAASTRCALHASPGNDQTNVQIYFSGPTPVQFRSDYLPSPFQQSPWWLSTPLALSGLWDDACLATDQTGCVWALAAGVDGLVLRERRPQEKKIRTYSLAGAIHRYLTAPVLYQETSQPLRADNLHLTCVANTPFAFVDRLLCECEAGQPQVLETLPGSVHAICPSLPHTRRRIAIAHTQGVDVYWLDRMQHRLQTIVRGTAYQHVAFLHGAHLATIAEDMLTIHQIRSDVVKSVRQIKLRSIDVLGLLSVSAECLAILFQDGSIDRYKAV